MTQHSLWLCRFDSLCSWLQRLHNRKKDQIPDKIFIANSKVFLSNNLIRWWVGLFQISSVPLALPNQSLRLKRFAIELSVLSGKSSWETNSSANVSLLNERFFETLFDESYSGHYHPIYAKGFMFGASWKKIATFFKTSRVNCDF